MSGWCSDKSQCHHQWVPQNWHSPKTGLSFYDFPPHLLCDSLFEGEDTLVSPGPHPGRPSRSGSCRTSCTTRRKCQQGTCSGRRCCPTQCGSHPKSCPGRDSCSGRGQLPQRKREELAFPLSFCLPTDYATISPQLISQFLSEFNEIVH